MAAAATTALALCALLAGASARSGNSGECTTVTKNDTSGRPVQLQRSYLQVGVKNVKVDIPSHEACAQDGRRPVGYKITVCDSDGPLPPNIATPSLVDAIVTRNTNAYSIASVDVTVYCAPAVAATLGSSEEDTVVSAIP